MTDVTQILDDMQNGDPQATEKLLPLVYDELRRLAAQRLTHEKPGQTLNATGLVHEAYLRLVNGANSKHWNGRGHFFGAAAEAMRRILVESARRKKALKYGGAFKRVSFDELEVSTDTPVDEILAVDEALDQFAAIDPQAAQVVKLHFFVGLTLEETSGLLGISVRTTYRDWSYARAWLANQLNRDKR